MYIAKYETPIGNFWIDEEFQVWFNGSLINGKLNSLEEAKEYVQKSYNHRFSAKMKELKDEIMNLERTSPIAEDYRYKL